MNKKKILLLIAIVISVFYLTPLFYSGYIGDDAVNSLNAREGVILSGESLWLHIEKIIWIWKDSQGRFFPLAWLGYSLYYYFPTLFGYKLLVAAWVLINILIWGLFINKITKSKFFTLALLILTPFFLQMRIYHEPILSYGGLMQATFIHTLLSLIFFQNYLEGKKKRWLALSMIFYSFALMTYEVSYIFFLFHLLLAFSHEKKISTTIKKSLGPVLTGGFFIGLAIYLRSNFTQFDIGYTINYDTYSYLKTLAKQILGGIPFSYHFGQMGYHINYLDCTGLLCAIKRITQGDLLLLALAVTSLSYAIKKITRPIPHLSLLLIGFLIATLPAVLTSLSVKHQGQLGWGTAYLPVYMQNFGMALIFFTLFHFGLLKIKRPIIKRIWSVFWVILLSTMILVNLQNNRLVVESWNLGWHNVRILISDALQGGLFSSIPDNALILKNGDQPHDYDNRLLFYRNTQRVFRDQHLAAYAAEIINTKPEKPAFFIEKIGDDEKYIFKYNSYSEEQGYAFVSRIESLVLDGANKKVLNAYLDKELVVFIKGQPNPYTHLQIQTLNKTDIAKNSLNPQTRIIPLNAVPIKGKGHDWLLFRIPINDDTVVDLNSISFNRNEGNLTHSKKIKPIAEKVATLLSSKPGSLIHSVFNDNYLVFNLINNELIGYNYGFNAKGLKNDATGFEFGLGTGIHLQPFVFGQQFTIELILKANKNFSTYNGIIGNHPGRGYDGFVLQQDGSPNYNSYSVGFGDGTKGIDCNGNRNFILQPDEWIYLAIALEKSSMRIFQNGKKIVDIGCNSDLITESELPLFLGNWIANDRPFNGIIEELHIERKLKTDEEVEETWENIKSQLKNPNSFQ